MAMGYFAEVGMNINNKVIKIFSKAVDEKDDKICSLRQLLGRWGFDRGEVDKNKIGCIII